MGDLDCAVVCLGDGGCGHPPGENCQGRYFTCRRQGGYFNLKRRFQIAGREIESARKISI
jgi:hypothetical protein